MLIFLSFFEAESWATIQLSSLLLGFVLNIYLRHVLSRKFYLNKSGDSVSAVRTWGNFWRVSPTKTRRECIRINVVAHACDLDTWEAEAGGS